MTKKELQEYIPLKKELEQLDRERQYWYTKAERCTSSNSSIRSGGCDPYPAIMDKLTEIGNIANAKFEELTAIRQRIENAIDTLDGRSRLLLRARYIDGKHWEQIAGLMNYDLSHIHRVHGGALEKLKKDETK